MNYDSLKNLEKFKENLFSKSIVKKAHFIMGHTLMTLFIRFATFVNVQSLFKF